MKTKTNILWLKKYFTRCLSSLLVVVFVFLQGLFFEGFFSNYSFDSGNIISQGKYQEIRQTDDGNIIQRFFTGIAEVPFVDYLLVENEEGKTQFIPLRNSTSFFEKSRKMFEDIFLFKHSGTFEKLVYFLIICVCFSFFLVIIRNFSFTKKEEVLLYSILSRQRIWLENCRFNL